MTFGSADDAIAFLAERSGAKAVTNSTPVTTAEVLAPSPAKAAADPKPASQAKAQKAVEPTASPSAAPAETASAAAEPAPAPTPAPPPTPVATSTGKPLEYASIDLPKRIAEMVGLGHTAAMKALLSEFGAKKGPEVPTDKLNEFDAKLQALEASLAAG